MKPELCKADICPQESPSSHIIAVQRSRRLSYVSKPKISVDQAVACVEEVIRSGEKCEGQASWVVATAMEDLRCTRQARWRAVGGRAELSEPCTGQPIEVGSSRREQWGSCPAGWADEALFPGRMAAARSRGRLVRGATEQRCANAMRHRQLGGRPPKCESEPWASVKQPDGEVEEGR